MQSKSWVAVLGAILLAQTSAFAAATEKGKNSGLSSGGASGGGSAGGGAMGASGGGLENAADRDNGLEPGSEGTSRKWWTVEATAEYHRLVRQSDLQGDAVNKSFDYYLLGAQFDPTDRDRIVVRGGMYERMIADQGETGLRLDDVIVGYTRLFPLPQKIDLRVQARTSIPVSFESKLSGVITAPRLAVSVERQFGVVTLSGLSYLEGYVQRYKESQGGNPNERLRLAALVEADVAMPFHKRLSFGVDFYEASTWYYEPGGSTPSGAQSFYGTTIDNQFPGGQPVAQVYGGEIFARYRLPELFGAITDLQVAYANGDPVLGYQSSLHDGVTHFNAFYRHVAEVYFALNAHY